MMMASLSMPFSVRPHHRANLGLIVHGAAMPA